VSSSSPAETAPDVPAAVPFEGAIAKALASLTGGANAGVVVHAAPGASLSARLDTALAEDVDGTLAALARATSRGVPLVLVSRLSAKPLTSSTGPVVLDDELKAARHAAQHATASALFADQLSRLADETKQKLKELGGASSGSAFRAHLEEAKAAAVAAAQARALVERAAGWHFATGSTWAARAYTASLAEMLVADAKVPVAVVRVPAILEGDYDEGHGLDGATLLEELLDHARASAAPLRLRARTRLEALPREKVALAVAVAALGVAKSRQGGVLDVNASTPLPAARLEDLLQLHLRREGKKDEDTSLFAKARRAIDLVEEAKELLLAAGAPAPDPLSLAPPFFVDDARFVPRALRVFATRAGVPPPNLDVDWRTELLDVQLPAVEARKAERARLEEKKPRPAWDSLGHLLVEVAERFGSRPALSLFVGDDVVDTTYSDLLDRARAVALRLQKAGVRPGDRVLLSGANHPAWGTVAFGVVLARATLVPLDPGLDDSAVRNIVRKSRPALAVVDKAQREKWAQALPEPVLDLQLTAVDGPGIDVSEATLPASDEVASILFTSGTTGEPKGVQLTHRNFCALLASLQSIFPVGRGDRMLSVLPLHHTFEFSCGFLMPLASGARIYTPDALTGERVLFALKHGRITALVGVPALWQLLERRISKQVQERGEFVQGVVEALLSANRTFAKRTGLSFGRIALKPIHDGLGGHLKTLISGGSALPPSVHDMFQGLGLPLAEGYGLTEAAPVLTVAEGVLGAPAGTVGRPIPGVEIRIVDPDPTTGIGEIQARAPNVMKGYFEDDAATAATLDEGWLKTGDLGKFDDEGRLRIMGRSKDVVVTASGENVYLDDIEKKLEPLTADGGPSDPQLVTQYTLLGLPDPKGGERLAMAYVVADGRDPAVVHRAVQQQILKLPAFARPSIVEAVPGPLPLTATRKVKRKDVRKTLEQILASKESEGASSSSETPMTAVRAAIALVAGVDIKKLQGSTRLPQDLGFDSLMWTELGAALEPVAGKLDPEVLVSKESIADIESYIREAAGRAAEAGVQNAADGVGERLDRKSAVEKKLFDVEAMISRVLLPVVKPVGRAAITVAQREAYRTIFDATVTGRAHIPHNRNAIVVANHTSHLDTGLVKFALGSYGKDLRPLAAKDYFFEGNKLKVGFIEHFTNLVPIDRETGSGLAFEQAKAVVEQGHVTLIFPEGTRREDGTLGSFKPLVARLSLMTGVDVLPIWMKGNYDALPRGTLVPNLDARHLEAHIGPPLAAKDMARLTAHLPPVQQARAATEVIRRAVVALSEGQMLDLGRVRTLDELERGLADRGAA
jgi:long-chain acyl-CoA synthetase